jgi:hypothetical protein
MICFLASAWVTAVALALALAVQMSFTPSKGTVPMRA